MNNIVNVFCLFQWDDTSNYVRAPPCAPPHNCMVPQQQRPTTLTHDRRRRLSSLSLYPACAMSAARMELASQFSCAFAVMAPFDHSGNMADKVFFSSRRKTQRRCPNPQAAGSSTPVAVTAPTSPPDDADGGSMTVDVGAGATSVRATGGVRFAPFRVDGRFADAMFVMSAAGPEPGV